MSVAKPRHVCEPDYAGFEHVKSVKHAQNVHNVCAHFLEGVLVQAKNDDNQF
jgi:hypothetical protein